MCAGLAALALLTALGGWTAGYCRQNRTLLVVGRYGVGGPNVRARMTMRSAKLVMRGHTYTNARYHDFGPAGRGLEVFSFGDLYVVELSGGGGSPVLSGGGRTAPAPLAGSRTGGG